jgi:hypothetical protein
VFTFNALKALFDFEAVNMHMQVFTKSLYAWAKPCPAGSHRSRVVTANVAMLDAKRSSGFKYTPPVFVPEEPPQLDMDLPRYSVEEGKHVDVAIAGAGPAGMATAARIAAQGLSVVVVDPKPLQHWPNNYGVWCDEFEAMGLQDCFEREWSRANVWLGDKDERFVSAHYLYCFIQVPFQKIIPQQPALTKSTPAYLQRWHHPYWGFPVPLLATLSHC